MKRSKSKHHGTPTTQRWFHDKSPGNGETIVITLWPYRSLSLQGFRILIAALATLMSLIGLGFFSTALAYLLYFTILSRAGSANLLLVTLLIPPVTISMTYSILNKTYNGEGLLGFALIASGLLVIDGRVVKSLKNISRTK